MNQFDDEAQDIPTPENLDIDFNDPRLIAEIDRGIEKWRETIEQRFADLEGHLGDAIRIASQIKDLLEKEQ
jgi:hypothetical protein